MLSVPITSTPSLQSIISESDMLCVSQSCCVSTEQWSSGVASGGVVLVQQPCVGTADRGGGGGGVLISHERCHYHANDFPENTIITNNRNLNISPGFQPGRVVLMENCLFMRTKHWKLVVRVLVKINTLR